MEKVKFVLFKSPVGFLRSKQQHPTPTTGCRLRIAVAGFKAEVTPARSFVLLPQAVSATPAGIA